jgi:peroxiredoxin
MNDPYRLSRRTLARSKAALLALLCVAAALFAAPAAAQAQLGSGPMAPDFDLPAIDGQPVRLSQFRGRFVVVHFAATWCPFCNAELPHLVALDKAYKGRGVQVLIVDVKEPKQLVARWAGRAGVAFPVLLDGDGAVATRYAPKDAQPALARDEVVVAANLLIDREGRTRFFSLLDTAQFDARLIALRAVLDELLAAGP